MDAPNEAARWVVRELEPGDRGRWEQLFLGYAAFYERELTAEQLTTVWRWIFEEHVVIALVVTRADDHDDVVGLAHLRTWIRPLRASTNGYLDDLFVDVRARGEGAVDALFDGICERARRQGWAIVRWTTATDNFRAQRVYDRYAERTSWVTYDLTP